MGIGVIAKLKVKAGKNDEFTAAFKQAQGGVRVEEQGCLYYDLYQSDQDPQTYVVMEHYKDDAAVELHRNTKHFAKLMAAGQACLDGPLDVQTFKLVSALR